MPNRGDGPAAATNGREGSASSASATSVRYQSSPDEAINASDAFIVSDTAAAPTLDVGRQTETTETISDNPNGDAPTPWPLTSPTDSGCTPTTSLLRFDGGYEVSMCYVTPDGVTGQAKAGLYASAESGLLWFFSRDNAEVLVKVLDGCSINGYRWVFVAPVTTLEFDLQVTSPTGVRWNHGNRQGETAATKSDVAAFACADEPEAAPDLIVSRVSVSDENPVADQTVTLRATVRNRGDGPATPTTLRYYRSDDSTISASDNSDDLLASDAVAALAASATESMTLDFRAPSTPGTFYVGVCIDSVPAESRTGNNCSASVRVVVEDEPDEGPEDDPDDDPDDEPATAPDLIVFGVSVSDATPVAGQTITLRATVRNRGDGPASPTTLRFYRSNDSTISTSDSFISSAAVPALSASATESMTLDFRAPSTPGTFYVGACIDPVSAESRTGNNCSASVRVVVEEEPDEDPDEPEGKPDLIVPDVSVSDAAPVAGQNITLRAKARNRGDGSAAPTTLHFIWSSDSTIDWWDLRLRTEAVAALAPSATQSLTLDFTVPSAGGKWYFGACIEPVSLELNTSNNCSDGARLDVEGPAPDLIVPDVSVSDANPDTGQEIDVPVTVVNQGDGPASATKLRLYQSDDPTINREDRYRGIASLPEMPPTATEPRTFRFTVSSDAGTFYLGACVDSVPGESDTDNNCSIGVPVTVREPGPDLIVPDISVSEANPVVDDVVKLQVTVQNDGDARASPTTLRYYRSPDSTINTLDDEVGSEAVEELAASAKEFLTFDFTTPSTTDTFHLGACIDSVSTETYTGNNCSDGVLVTVHLRGPDLTVSDISVSDENPAPGQKVTLSFTATNQGDAPASRTTLRYYRSPDSTISAEDLELGGIYLRALAASDTESGTHVLTASPTAETFFLGVCIGSVSGESDKDNNCSIGVRVTVE